MIDGFSLIGADDSFQHGTAESVRQEMSGTDGQFFLQFGSLFLKTGKLPFFSMACKLFIIEKSCKGMDVSSHFIWLVQLASDNQLSGFQVNVTDGKRSLRIPTSVEIA